MNSLPSPAPAIIGAQGISRRDALSGQVLLQPTDFSLQGGERVALTGRSGSGKSVLLRALALLDPLDAGGLLWRGATLGRDDIPRYRRHVGYLGQRPALFEGTVEDNLRYPYSLKVSGPYGFDRGQVLALLEQAGRGAAFLAQRASELSGGEAQITAMVRTLQLRPHVLLLDEPTASLDPESAQRVEQLVGHWLHANTAARAFVWVSHDPQQASRVSNRRVQMAAGVLSEAP